jgi:hypothetical protein
LKREAAPEKRNGYYRKIAVVVGTDVGYPRERISRLERNQESGKEPVGGARWKNR